MKNGPLGDVDKQIEHLQYQKNEITKARRTWEEFDKKLSFPCDVTKFKKASKIVLQGEDHADPICNMEKCDLVSKGAEGICHVGLEGVYCDMGKSFQEDEDLQNRFPLLDKSKIGKNSRVYGYDHSMSHGYGILLYTDTVLHNLIASDKNNTKKQSSIGTTFLINMVNNPHLKETWKNIIKKNTLKGEDENKIIEFISSIQDKSPNEVEKQTQELSATHPLKTNPEAFQKILHALLRSYVDLATRDHKESQFVPQNLREVTEKHISDRADVLLIQIALIEWRNRFMVKNIADLYCKAAEEGKDLYIVTGALHLGGQYELLKKMTQNNLPPIEVVRSPTMEDVAKILKSNTEKLPRNSGLPIPRKFDSPKLPSSESKKQMEKEEKRASDELKTEGMQNHLNAIKEISTKVLKKELALDEKKLSFEVEPYIWEPYGPHIKLSIQYPISDLEKILKKKLQPGNFIFDSSTPTSEIEKQINKVQNKSNYSHTVLETHFSSKNQNNVSIIEIYIGFPTSSSSSNKEESQNKKSSYYKEGDDFKNIEDPPRQRTWYDAARSLK